MKLARTAVLVHAIPVSGIPSSIFTLNPPLSIYLALPFTAFGPDPMPIVVSIALWNVLGVALCYVFADRYFGRLVAGVGTLFFATCGVAVDLSRFLWQQNYLPPLVLLWAFTLYAGCVAGRRRWFVPNVLILMVAALLHPSAALLAPVTGVAVLLAPQRPARWEYLAAGGGIAVLLTPTGIAELVNHHMDVHFLRQYLARPSSINLDVLQNLLAAVRAPTFPGAGGASPYAHVTATSPYAAQFGLQAIVQYLIWLLYGAGYIVLTAAVVAPLWRHVQASRLGDPQRSWAGLLRSVWRAVRDDAGWRAWILLWFWITVPVTLMLRHSSEIYPHYLLEVFPAVFLLAGLAAQWAWTHAKRRIRPAGLDRGTSGAAAPALAMRAVLLGAFGALVSVQALQCLLYIQSLVTGQFVANAGYGYTLGATQAASRQLGQIQRAEHASWDYISMPLAEYEPAFNYLLVNEQPARTGFGGDCLLLPPANESALVVATHAPSAAGQLLATLPTAHRVATIALPGGEPFTAYRVQGTAPALSGERATVPVRFQSSAGDGLQLQGVVPLTNGSLLLRWQVLTSTQPGAAPAQYSIEAQAAGSDTAASATSLMSTCAPSQWRAGETLFTWLSPRSGAGVQTSAPVGSPSIAGIALTVVRSTSHLQTNVFGPLRTLVDAYTGDPPRLLSPVVVTLPSVVGGQGAIDASGTFILPARDMPPAATASPAP